MQMQRASQHRGTRSLGEAALRMGTQYLNKRRYDKMAEEEKASGKARGASEAALLAAMQGGPQLDFQGKPVMNDDAFTGTPQQADPQAQLGQLLTQHPNSDIGRMAAQMQLQQAYAKPKEPEWNLKEIKSGDQYETWITRDNLPVEKFSTADRMQQVMSGTPAEWGTESQQGSHIIEFGKKLGSIDAWGTTGTEFVEMLMENPGANTTVATLANFGNKLWNEVKALKQQGVYEFADDFRGTDIKLWEDVFSANGLAGANARVKRGFLALAIQGAAAQGMGTGRALSDRDVEQQLQTLGASQSDPRIIGNIFADSYKSMINGVQSEAKQFPYLQEKFDSGEWSINEYDFGASRPRVRTYIPGQGLIEE